MVLFYTVLFWVAELFWQNSAEAELGRTSQIRPNPNFGTELRRISKNVTALFETVMADVEQLRYAVNTAEANNSRLKQI
jgi:hypothetical protein